MVYKIRNKGFNNTIAALNPRVHPAKKTKINGDLERYITMQVHITRFTGMRILHNYRNIPRATKQFLMGDKILEQLMILTIKEHFFRPLYYRSPIENSFYIVSPQNIIHYAGKRNGRSYWQTLCSFRKQPAPTPALRLRGVQQVPENCSL